MRKYREVNNNQIWYKIVTHAFEIASQTYNYFLIVKVSKSACKNELFWNLTFVHKDRLRHNKTLYAKQFLALKLLAKEVHSFN